MTQDSGFGNIRIRGIEDEMRSSYLDYAMSVIVSRALPDVRDGLKPVQRRILYAMHDMGLRPNVAFRKSAAIVGEVLGKYHPHGDSPVYEAMARMAQDFSLRYPLIHGQGNFGSVDGDPPAAMRYTEAKMSRITEELLADIDSNTVDAGPTYDDQRREPLVLPARAPNLLLNGASGIAVGMATNIPPHNLGEICDAVALLIETPETTTEELSEVVKGPDFPTAGLIYRRRRDSTMDDEGKRHDVMRDAIKEAYADGRGRIIMQARATIEEMARGNREQIIVTELPYQVNKATLIEKIADLVKDRKIVGISDLRDESDRHGMRIVIELSRDGQAASVLNQLYKHTAMQSSFAVNMVALDHGQPKTMGLKKILEAFIDHRREVIRRRTEFELEKAHDREHLLLGYLIALKDIDKIIALIRAAASAEEAKEKMMAKPWNMSDRQAQAVLDMQLRRLAKLERGKITDEYQELLKTINYLEDLLANPRKIDYLIRDDVTELKEKYGDDRRTQIMEQEPEEFSEEDMVAHQEVVVTISSRGYIKRIPLSTYRSQHRGGVGIIGAKTKDDDDIRHLIVADTHDKLIFFTDRGRCFQVKTYEVDEGKREARGQSIMQMIMMDQKERITAVVRVMPGLGEDKVMVMATERGEVKKTPMKNFANVRRDGLIAMDLEADDEFVSAHICTDDDDVIMVTAKGQANRFAVEKLRSASRLSGGVRGMKLRPGDKVVAMEVAIPDHALLVVSALGQGKRTPVDDYPQHGRGGQGVITFKTHAKSGDLVTAHMVDPEHELIFISEGGIIMRTPVKHISQQGRPTQGVNLMDVGKDDKVAAVAVIDMRKEYADAELPTGAVAEASVETETNGNGAKVAPKRGKSSGTGTNGKKDK